MKENGKRKLELLAPAKNYECGMAAIQCGADAIYIGAPKFGARSAVGNSIEDIEKLCEAAHFYGAKVFVTFNTIIYDDELTEAETLINKLYDAKVDALIIQDMGILKLDLPPIALHASTQTNNYELDRIQFMDQLGFDRIVLARELGVEQIKEAYENTEAELEVFVHGSLCVSLSGQCYMSYHNGGRSANRGACQYSCRHNYTLVDADGERLIENQPLLSLKDMDRSQWLKELADAGTTSFKIEGRLKDADYVKNIVTHYRKALDKVIEESENYTKASSGVVEVAFEPDVQKSFSRGQTDYFLHGRQPNIASKTVKSIGEEIGEVVLSKKGYFDIKTDKTLNNNDGLTYLDKNGRLIGIKVNRAENNRIYPAREAVAPLGVTIYRNYDHAFRMLIEKAQPKRNVEIAIRVCDHENGVKLTAQDEDGITSELEFSIEKQIARNVEKSEAMIRQQLSKAGQTRYSVTSVDIELESPLFFRAAELNQIRRDLLDKHTEKREQLFVAQKRKRQLNDSVRVSNSELGYDYNVTNSLSRQFYIDHGAEKVDWGYEIDEPEDVVLMTTKLCLRYELGHCPKYSEGQQEEPLREPLFLYDKRQKFKLNFDCKRCVMQVIAIDNPEK